MSPIAGFTSLRKIQIGKQSAILTAVPATRVLPYRGPIVVNPNRTQPDVDTGALDPILAAFAGSKEVTQTMTGKQAFNDLTYVFAAAGKGGETSSGATAKLWTFDYASLTADDFEYMTVEYGDDTAATDGIRGVGGVVDSYTLGFGEDLGAWDHSSNWIYARGDLATDRTAALTVDTSPTWVYGADTEVFLDSVAGSIGTTKLVDAVHSLSWNWQNNLDQKRFANGSNTRFALSGFGRGQRVIELTIQVAKTAATIAERATLDDDPIPTRYVETRVTSPVIITGSTPYSWSRKGRAELVSAADTEIGGNSTITFVYRVKYDGTLTYAVRDTLTNTLAAL